jgi:predicted nicotinamide N-methyase
VRLLQVLARYISRRGKALQGLNVLELGSGTGLVGLVAGFCGARVYITDQACARLSLSKVLRFITVSNSRPLMPIMERNIALNNLQANVTAAELDWYVSEPPPGPGSVPFRSKPLPEHLPQPDIVLAADCVYFEPAFPLLVATLASLVPLPHSTASPEVLFCYKKRRKADKRFFSILKKQFTWSVVCLSPFSQGSVNFAPLNLKSIKKIKNQ